MLRRTCSSSGANGVPLKVLVSCLRNFSCSRVSVSIDTLTREQEKFRKQLTNTFSGTPFAPLEEHVRRNMELFQQTFSMFKPFAPRSAGTGTETDKEKTAETA